MTPSTNTLLFLTAPCRYGSLLVAGTDKGICTITLGDTQEEMAACFQAHFVQADHKPTDPRGTCWLQAVLAYIEDPEISWTLPLDMQGTPFQCKVWSALQEITPGTTVTYTELAHRINQPTATRAVGRACAHNRLALVVPCHRAVRADGDLAGYRWGSQRKAAILQYESQIADLPPHSLFSI